MKNNGLLHAGTSTSARAPAGTNSPHRILVVDDDNSIRQLSTAVLIQFGYGVDSAADGAAAWQALNAESYDLLITDHNMPKVSGVELLAKLRAARMTLPAILVSGAMPTAELNRHPCLRIEATLLKPFTVLELLGTVKKVLRATDGAQEPMAPSPNWQSQPANDWQL